MPLSWKVRHSQKVQSMASEVLVSDNSSTTASKIFGERGIHVYVPPDLWKDLDQRWKPYQWILWLGYPIRDQIFSKNILLGENLEFAGRVVKSLNILGWKTVCKNDILVMNTTLRNIFIDAFHCYHDNCIIMSNSSSKHINYRGQMDKITFY